MNSWNGTLEYVKQHTQPLLRSLDPGFRFLVPHILMALMCISCVRQNAGLADYTISLVEDPPSFVSSMKKSIWKAGWEYPNPQIWSRLFDLGWASVLHSNRENFSDLAKQTFIPNVPQVDLLEVLFKNGLTVSDDVFWISAGKMDPDKMRYMVSKIDASQMNNSAALAIAALANPRVLDILLDGGMDINWMHDNLKMRDPRDGWDSIHHTALHVAARWGNRESAEVLLRRGAKRDIKDTSGKTATEVAVRYKHQDIADLIETFTPQL